MRLEAFRALVRRLAAEVPDGYLDGIAEVTVSPRAVPHPVHGDVYTLGQCVPFDTGGDEVVSRVVLYHGSFRALAADRPDFDWEDEARETLLHEIQHHLEWRADSARLEAYDWAAEQHFARSAGEPFDPLFFEAGETLEPGVYQVEDDIFLDRVVGRRMPAHLEVIWHGARYRVPVPAGEPPMFLTLDGLGDPPAGEVVVVARRKPRLWQLFRRPGPVLQERVDAERIG
jgi:hypothetical protein